MEAGLGLLQGIPSVHINWWKWCYFDWNRSCINENSFIYECTDENNASLTEIEAGLHKFPASGLLTLLWKSIGATATSTTATLLRNSYNKVAYMYATGRRLKTKVPRRKAGVGAMTNFTCLSSDWVVVQWGCLRQVFIPPRWAKRSPGEAATSAGDNRIAPSPSVLNE